MPFQVKGFRVSEENLDGLIRAMHKAYGSRPSAPASMGAGAGRTQNGNEEPPEFEEAQPATGALALAVAESDGDGWFTATAAVEADGRQVVLDGDIGQSGDSATEGGLGHAVESAVVVDDEPDQDGETDKFPSDDDAEDEIRDLELDVEADQELEGVADADAAEAPASPGAGLEAGPLIEVQCFGDFSVRYRGRELSRILDDRACNRAFEILAYLTIHPNGGVSKDRLMVALWPEVDEKQGDSRLHTEMRRLRNVLASQVPGIPREIVRCDRNGVCWLDPRIIRSDAQEFLACCAAAAPKADPERALEAVPRALELYRDNLLSGANAAKYVWMDERRDSGLTPRDWFRDEHRRAMARLGQLYLLAGQANLAIPLFQRLLEDEPTIEEVVRDLARCYELLGDLELVERAEDDLRAALAKSFSKPREPTLETVTLLNEIRARLQGRSKPAA